MGRKRIHDCNAYKFTFTLEDDNKDTLEFMSNNFNLKVGPMLNMLLRILRKMPEKIRKALIAFCESQIDLLQKEKNGAGEYDIIRIQDEQKNYADIIRVLQFGVSKIINNESIMQIIQLRNGRLHVPQNWIILNEEEAAEYTEATVMECRHADAYGIPHFVLLNNYRSNNYTEEFYEEFQKKCEQKWPEFHAKVIDRQVELLVDSTGDKAYLNAEEYLAAPTIGYFRIAADDDDNYDASEKQPYNAIILRQTDK